MYEKLTIKKAIALATPHTWPLGITPVILGSVLSIVLTDQFSPLLFYLLIVISILMQSSVNSFNDYYDFITGTDTVENSDDPTDAMIVYSNINPRHVFFLGISYLIIAFLIGLKIISVSGFLPLYIGLIGVLVIVLYSAGPFPVSYMPISDLVAGFSMGGLIPFVVYYVFSGVSEPKIFYYALPTIITIALMAFANNTCDIERDGEAGRKTLSILLGRRNAAILLKAVVIFDILLVAHIIFYNFRGGIFIILFMLIHIFPTISQLLKFEYTPDSRMPALVNILKFNLLLNIYYMLMILASPLVINVL